MNLKINSILSFLFIHLFWFHPFLSSLCSPPPKLRYKKSLMFNKNLVVMDGVPNKRLFVKYKSFLLYISDFFLFRVPFISLSFCEALLTNLNFFLDYGGFRGPTFLLSIFYFERLISPYMWALLNFRINSLFLHFNKYSILSNKVTEIISISY